MPLTAIADAQVENWRRFCRQPPSEAMLLINRARRPAEIRQAVMRERPVLDRLRLFETGEPDPVKLREEARAAGVLAASKEDLDYRRLYPGLDIGVYCNNHAIGKPSIASAIALEEHRLELMTYGMGVFSERGWMDLVESFRNQVADLIGDDLSRDDIMWYPNFSEGLAATLAGLTGRLVTTEGHFTTAHYIHELWAKRTGTELVRLPIEPEGTIPLGRLVNALTEDTAIVSLSHAFYKTGFTYDMRVVGAMMKEICPSAVLLLDAYQTLGTVPLNVAWLPEKTAVFGGGVKQLRTGTGAGFAWYSDALLEELAPDRTGWWGHENPMAFSHGAMKFGPRAAGLRTGTPSFAPLVSILADLRAFASSAGGEVFDATIRAREVTQANVAKAIGAASAMGLNVQGGADADRLAAFFAIRVDDGPRLLQTLAEQGIFVDFRDDEFGSNEGVMRLSTSAAGFGYELVYAVERLAAAI